MQTMKRYFLHAVLLLCALTSSMGAAFFQSPPRTTPAQERSLKAFLQDFVGEKGLPEVEETRYVRAFVDLNDDGKAEAIVFLVGPPWCGSGGCQMLILTFQRDSWKILSRILATHTPIRVLRDRSNGWHNLSVLVKRYNTTRREEAIRFDGKTYRLSTKNPVVVGEGTPGEVVIPSVEGAIFLFR